MERKDFAKQLIDWANDHYWDSLEKDKIIIMQHLLEFLNQSEKQLRTSKLKGYLDYLQATHEPVPEELVKAINDRIELIKKGEV